MCSDKAIPPKILRLLIFVYALLVLPSINAATYNWTNQVPPSDGNWSTALNWSNNTVPASGIATTNQFLVGWTIVGVTGGVTQQINSTNDIPNPFFLNQLNLGGTGAAAGAGIGAVALNIFGNQICFTNNSSVNPLLRCSANSPTGGSNLTYNVFVPIDLNTNTVSIIPSVSATFNFYGAISGAGGIFVSNNVTLGTGNTPNREGVVLLATNSFTGPTIIAAGSLAVGASNAVGYSSIIVSNGAQFRIHGKLSPMPVFTNSLTLVKNGILYSRGNGASYAWNGPITLNTGGTIRGYGANIVAHNLGGGIYGVGPLTLIGDGNQGTTNIFNLAAACNYSGGTLLQTVAGRGGSRLVLMGNNYLPETTLLGLSCPDSVTSNKLVLNGYSQRISGLTNSAVGNNYIVGGSATPSTLIVSNNTDCTYSGNLGGSADENNFSFVKEGLATFVILGASNSYTGNTTISSGTLAIGAAGTISNSAAITIATNAVFDVQAVTGGFVLNSNQTLRGIGSVIGDCTINGTLEPGITGVGTLTVSNSLQLGTSSVIRMKVDATSGTADLIQDLSGITYDGKLIVTNISNAAFTTNSSFQLFSAANYMGEFATMVLPSLDTSLVWDTSRLPIDGSIRVVSASGSPPIITATPHNRSVVAGSAATFDVTAAGSSPIYYQWRYNGASILNETNTSLTRKNVLPADAGNYSVRVSNPWGKTISSNATLVVTFSPVAPQITSQPSDMTVVENGQLQLSVAASGTDPLTYHWFKDNSTLTNGARISGADAEQVSISGLQLADAGGYSVTVQNSAGMITSRVATVSIIQPPRITQSPQDQTIPPGSSATFSVAATGYAPLSYFWRKNGLIIAAPSSSSFTIANATFTNAGAYDVMVSNFIGTATSQAATLLVVPPAGSNTVVYTYDKAGRLMTAQRTSLERAAYTYDNAHNLTGAYPAFEGPDLNGNGIPDAWEIQYFGSTNLAGAHTDFNTNGIVDFVEYALGYYQASPQTQNFPRAEIRKVAGVDYLFFIYQRNKYATQVGFEVQVSQDLQDWQGDISQIEQMGLPSDNFDGTESVILRCVSPLSEFQQRFVRLNIRVP